MEDYARQHSFGVPSNWRTYVLSSFRYLLDVLLLITILFCSVIIAVVIWLGLEWYWHWVVLLLGDIFFIVTPNTKPPDSSQHHAHDNHLDVCGAAVDSRWRQGEWGGDRVQAIHHHHTVEILCGIVLHIFCFKNQYIAMLHSSISIGIGFWYR